MTQNHAMDAQPANPARAWLVTFAASLYFFFEFMQLNMFNSINPDLMQAFHIGAARLGQLSANYFYAVIIFIFPAGILLDRFSTRKIIISAMSIGILCTFGFSMATNIYFADVCRFITGIAGSFCLLSCVRLASRWFPSQRMALVVGSVVTFAMIGGMIAQTPFTLMITHFGWRQTVFMNACFGIILLAAIIAWVRDYPPNRVGEYDKHRQVPLRAAIKQVIRNPQNWLGGLYTCIFNLPIFILGAIWGNMFLVQAHGLSRANASLVSSMIFFGTIIGSPLLGWLSDKIHRRRSPMIICGLLSLLTVITIIFWPTSNFVDLFILFFLLGLFTSAQIIPYPLIAESNPIQLTGTAESVGAMIVMAGGLSQPIFGWLMERHWNHSMLHHLPVYATSDYKSAMLILPVTFVIGLLAACLIRETHAKNQHTPSS